MKASLWLAFIIYELELKGGNLDLQFVNEKKFNHLGDLSYMQTDNFDVQEGVFMIRYFAKLRQLTQFCHKPL